MEVISERCKSSKTNEYVLIIFLSLIAGLFFYASITHWGINTKSPAFWISCVLILFILLYIFTPLFSETNIKEIRVNPKEIQIDYRKNKTEILNYKNISKISSEKVRIQSPRGYLTDGYFVTTLYLKNGKDVRISQREFENYRQIIASIGHNLRNYNF